VTFVDSYRVQDVRAAEGVVLAATAEGALMQRAAAALAVAGARMLRSGAGSSGPGRVTGRHVVLLVGPGNNGGDALWAGARLRARGAAVTALLTSPKTHPEGLAGLRRAGGRALAVGSVGQDVLTVLAGADLFVDGLLGLGGRPGLREPAASMVRALPYGVPVIAVDLPSGVDPDTGELPEDGASVRADLTVTFGAAKGCLLLPPASVAAGAVEVVELGFGPHLPVEPLVQRLAADDLARLWPVPAPGMDKYRRGVLGMVTGSAGYPGAAVLAVGGALRAGVGMIRYVGPPDATDAVRHSWPEVVAGEGRVQAWALGSGVNPDADDDQPAAIRRAIDSGEPCLLDAGAIGMLPDGRGDDRSDRFLLTPHAGELATLLGVDRADVERRPYRHALRAAERTGATVLLKGSTTLVVRPDGRARSQAEAPSWLATAGAGDTLAGIAGALLAAGLPPFDAGAVAASVHGRAATAAAGTGPRRGPGGPIIAGDIATHVPAVIAALLA
jgi:hydroxyethylthiazole kinase-like uncharacterized protein yjeF